jgi:hypothetical protein
VSGTASRSLTPHGRPYMLIRLDAPLEDVREFLTDSWLIAAPKSI